MKFSLKRLQSQLISYFPYFAAIGGPLTDMVEGTSIDTANGASKKVAKCATNGEDVVFNKEYMDTLTTEEQNFRSCEMVLALARRQHLLRGTRNEAIWQTACSQCRLNELSTWIEESKSSGSAPRIGVPKDANIDKSFAGMTEFEIYDLLSKRDGKSGGAASDDDGMVVDAKGLTGISGEDSRYISSKSSDILTATRQAEVRARQAGSQSSFWAKLADNADDCGPDPEAMLNRFMNGAFPTERSWSVPDRRAWAMGQLMPGEVRDGVGTLAMLIDCSGSMVRKSIAEVMSWVSFACETCKPEKIHVIYFTTQVDRHDIFEFYETFKVPDEIPDGGTCFVNIRKYLEDNAIKPDAEIWFTDGYDTYPSKPDYPSLWLMTEMSHLPPYGEVWEFYSKIKEGHELPIS